MPVILWADVPLDQRGEPWMTRYRHPRLWLTANGRRLVLDGDPDADVLAIGENEYPPTWHRADVLTQWLANNQPAEPSGCPAAIRDRDGLYHPCTTAPKDGQVFCWRHDPERHAAIQIRRAEARADYTRWIDRQACAWVGEGVPA